MRFLLWFRRHPWVTVFLGLLGFSVADHFFMNWLAEASWQRYCTEARARGVKLTLAELTPPKIPDEENFAALPMFRAIFAGGVHHPMELPRGKIKLPSIGDPIKKEKIDWKAWQKYCQDVGWVTELTDSPPQDVLRGLEHYDPQFKEWSEWRHRPRSVFPLDLQAGNAMPLPHLNAFHDAATLFSLRIRARLALGDSAGAYVELQDGLQTWRGLEEDPTLISHLAQMSMLTLLLNAIGDGLKERAWSEPELEKIATDFKDFPIWKSFRRAFATERAFENWTYEQLIHAPSSIRKTAFDDLSLPIGGSMRVPLVFIPQRVYRENQLRTNRYFDEILARASAKGGFAPNAPSPSSPEKLRGLVEPHYFYFFIQTAGFLPFAADRFVTLHTVIDEMRIACALERYHQVQHEYPETLQELTPAFLEAVPLDLFSGKPLIYQRKAGEPYLLYGVGRNRRDEGGAIDPKRSDQSQRDDIWLYAPSVP